MSTWRPDREYLQLIRTSQTVMTDGILGDGDLMEAEGARNSEDTDTDQDDPSLATNDNADYIQQEDSFSLAEAESNFATDAMETDVALVASAQASLSHDNDTQDGIADDHQQCQDSAAEEEQDEESGRSSAPRCRRDDDDNNSSEGGRMRGRRNGNGRDSTGIMGRGRGRDSEQNRDEQRSPTGTSGNSVSPRWDSDRGRSSSPGAARGGAGLRDDSRVDASPRRRGGGGEGGPQRPPEELEPSKVLHVRNVGYPVTQADLSSLLGCFGQVEKIKMFNGQALVQLPSIAIARATMRHFEEVEEPRIGNKRIYINYSRSKSIEARDGGDSGGGGGGASNNGPDNGRSSGGGRGGAGGVGGGEGAGASQDSASPYAHLIMEDHAKLVGLATMYLQNYGIPGGEGAVLNINQREEMAEYQRQAMAAAITLNGGANASGLTGWNGTAAAAAAVTAATTTRLGGNLQSGGFSGYAGRQRSSSRGQDTEAQPDRSQQNRRPPR